MKLTAALRKIPTTMADAADPPDGVDADLTSTDGILVDPTMNALVAGNGKLAVILPIRGYTGQMPGDFVRIPTAVGDGREMDLSEALAHARRSFDWGHGTLQGETRPTAGKISFDARQLALLAHAIGNEEVTLHVPTGTHDHPTPMRVTAPGEGQAHGYLVIQPGAVSGFQTASAAAAAPAPAAADRPAADDARAADGPPELRFNSDHGGIELHFSGIPPAAVREILKRKDKGCFAYHRVRKMWFTKDKPAARKRAAEVFAHYGAAMPDCPPLPEQPARQSA